jgi:hypothetical protein
MGWIAGLLLPIAAALVLVRRAGSLAGRLALAAAVAATFTGAASLPWGPMIAAGLRSTTVLVAIDAALWAAVIVAAWKRPPAVSTAPAIPASDRWLLVASLVLLAGTALLATAHFVAASALLPHGDWDAWAQWNLRARFFYRGLAGGTWRTAFDPSLAWSHADYPPLVPLSVTRLWAYGRQTVAAPIALAALFSAAIAVMAGASVAATRGAARGALASAAILACPSFVRWAPSQCADIPLACLMLAAFVLWRHERPLLAGLAAALAAWTKNEGAAFLVLFLAAAAVAGMRARGWRGLGDVVPMAAGAAPVVLLVVVFKHTLAPPSYFVEEQTLAQAFARLTDTGRLAFIARAVGPQLWFSGASIVGVLPIVGALFAVRGPDSATSTVPRYALVVMAAMLVSYTLAYAVTPKDLAWQLQTSADRVILQLIPTLVWAVLSFAA